MDWSKQVPRDVNFKQKIHDSFARQAYMGFIGARLGEVTHGGVEIILPAKKVLMQQHGYFHGGVIGAIADSAAGYAALTMFEAETGVLTSEFKINFLRPGEGSELIARGKVLRPGNVLTVCQADVFCQEKHIATALITMAKAPNLEN